MFVKIINVKKILKIPTEPIQKIKKGSPCF